ncbi:phasin_2, phasin [Rhabdaerophilaceae bacterium]
MMKTPDLNVPDDVREAMDKSVRQARAGFEKVMQATDEAARGLDEKTGTVQKQVLDMRRKAMAFTEQNVTAAFELAAQMVRAKSMDEVLKLQTDYMSKTFASMRGQVQEAGQAIEAQTRAAAAEIVTETRKMQDKAKDAVEQGVAAVKKAAPKPASRTAPKK